MDNDNIYDFYIPKYMDLGIGCTPNKNLHNYYLEYVLKKKEVHVLEVGYGSGLLTLLFLENNIKVVAIDKSNYSKAFLNNKCLKYNLLANLVIEPIDILEYSTNQKFATILATDDFLINLQTLNKLNLFVSKISQLLGLNGTFITDTRFRDKDEFTGLNCYPIYTLKEEVDGIKYVRCTSWNNLTDENIILVNYQYEEMDSNGVIINSFIRILKQGIFTFEELKMIANKNNLSLSIKEECSLGCHIFLFTKIK